MINKLIKKLNMVLILPVTADNYDKKTKTFYIKHTHEILMKIIEYQQKVERRPIPRVILVNEKTGNKLEFTNPSWTAGFSATYTCGDLILKLHDNLIG